MATGRKTGGRAKGVPNKRTRDVQERLDALDCDPISAMAIIAKQAMAENNLHLAAKMYAELAPYIAPKRRSVEVTRDDAPELDYEAALRERQQLQERMQAEVAKGMLEKLPAELKEQVQQHLEERTH